MAPDLHNLELPHYVALLVPASGTRMERLAKNNKAGTNDLIKKSHHHQFNGFKARRQSMPAAFEAWKLKEMSCK